MNVLVTGGAGFIGSEIAKFHYEKGDLVWVIDDLSTGRLENLNFSIYRFDKQDMTQGSVLEEALIWADWVYHMAAIVGQTKVLSDPFKALLKNVECSEALFKLAKPHHRIFFASTASVYWYETDSDKIVSEDSILKIPSNISAQKNYMLSKILGENLAQSSSCFTVVGRIFNVYGEKQQSSYGAVIPRFIEQCKSGKAMTIYGDGSQKRSFLHVEDLVQYLYLIMKKKTCSAEIYNIGSSCLISLSDLALLVKKITSSDSSIQYMSYKDAYGMDFKEAINIVPSFDKIQNCTFYSPNISLENGIAKIAKL